MEQLQRAVLSAKRPLAGQAPCAENFRAIPKITQPCALEKKHIDYGVIRDLAKRGSQNEVRFSPEGHQILDPRFFNFYLELIF